MPSKEAEKVFKKFLQESDLLKKGALITDLDGTALHERNGEVHIPSTIKDGIEQCGKLNIPVVINTLRFPMSFIRTFGHEWYDINRKPIPTILLNGSSIGQMVKTEKGLLEYLEIKSFPLTAVEIDELMDGIELYLDQGLGDLLLFYYPKEWRSGEHIWTPVVNNIPEIKVKYTSATVVHAIPIKDLRNELKDLEVNMILVLKNTRSELMAYQQVEKNSYVTTHGVNKTTGTIQLAKDLHIDLEGSIGSGDTQLDTFIQVTGLAIQVGPRELTYNGKKATIKVPHPLAYGELLSKITMYFNLMKLK